MDTKVHKRPPRKVNVKENLRVAAYTRVPYHMSPGELFNRERAEQFVTDSALILEPGETIEW